MNEPSPEMLASLRRWWRRLPLEHPFVRVIRERAGDPDASNPPDAPPAPPSASAERETQDGHR